LQTYFYYLTIRIAELIKIEQFKISF